MGLRNLYDRVERAATPALTSATHSADFVQIAATTASLNKFVRRRLAGAAGGLWHTLNLPTRTDVQKMRNQLGALDREVRLLTLELERRPGKEVESDGPRIAQSDD